MNALVPVAAPALPALSQPLAYLVQHHADPIPGRPRVPDTVTEAQRAEAHRAWRQCAAACEPAPLRRIRAWLVPVAAAVRNAPSGEDFDARAAVIARVCADLPGAVWTEEARVEALREWQFWPSAADVFKFLDGRAAPLVSTMRALRAIADAALPAPAEPEWRPPTEHEKAEIAATVAQLGVKRPAMPADRPKPLTFSPELLRAAYERQAQAGGKAAELAYARLTTLPPREDRGWAEGR